MKLILSFSCVFILGTATIQAQNIVQVHIDHGGLHCPFLGPRFESRFTELTSVDSVHLDTKNSIGLLYMADGFDISDEDIADIVVNKVGYPEREIKAIVRDEN
jgi:hypothetical protein